MLTERRNILFDWNRILGTTSEMLEIVRKRNALLKKAANPEKEFRKQEAHYQEFMQKLHEFDEIETDESISSIIKVLNLAIEKHLSDAKKTASTYLTEFKEAATLTHKIEEYKKILTSFLKMYKEIKLRKEEISNEKLYELVTLILLANENDSSISEQDFFETKEVFFKMLSESEDPILQKLICGTTITSCNTLDTFLELL